MAKQSKSQRIRTLLAQGKSVKEIVKTVKCHPGLVYQVKSYDKTKKEKAIVKKWKSGVVTTNAKPVLDRTTGKQWDAGQIYQITQPRDYYQPKPGIFKRIANWFMGC